MSDRETGGRGDPGEVQAEFRDQMEGDLDTDDAEGEATRGDLHDLNP